MIEISRNCGGECVVGASLAVSTFGQQDASLGPRRLSGAALARVLAHLEAHLADDVSVAELAAVAGLSAGHFSGLFRNATSEPPHRYHIRLRVQRARQLIESGVNASDAALQVGFFDQSHLTRHMRRLLGTVPGELRKRRRRAIRTPFGGAASGCRSGRACGA